MVVKVLKKSTCLVVFLALMISLVAACGGAGGSPTGVVNAFYKEGNAGNYAKAKSYLSVHTQQVYAQMGAFMTSFERQMDRATKNGTITRVEIKGGEEFAGDTGVVYATIHYKDGTKKDDNLVLRKEGGSWKIYTWTLGLY